MYKKVTILIPSLNSALGKTPGSGLVSISRAKELQDIMFIDGSAEGELLTIERLMKIGKSEAYMKRRLFEQKLKKLESCTMPLIEKEICQHDPTGNANFAEGYLALVHWFRNKIH